MTQQLRPEMLPPGAAPLAPAVPARFLQEALLTMVCQGVMLALSVVTVVVSCRILGPEQRGALSILLLAAHFLILLGTGGMGSAAVHYLGKQRFCRRSLASNLLQVAVVAGILLASTTVMAMPLLRRILPAGTDRTDLLFLLVMVPGGIAWMHARSILQAERRMLAFNGLAVLQTAAVLAGFALLAALTSPGTTSGDGTLAWALATVLAAAAAIWMIRKDLWPWRPLDPALLRATGSYGAQANVGNIIQFLNVRLDMFLLLVFCGEASVGIYFAALSLADLVLRIPAAVGIVLFPRVASGDAACGALTSMACRNTNLLVILGSLAIWLVGKPAIALLFGPEFGAASGILGMLLVAHISLSIYQVLYNDLVGRGRATSAMVCSVVMVIAVVLLDLLLIPRHGIAGAAVAVAIGHAVGAAAALAAFRRATGTSLKHTLVPGVHDLRNLLMFLSGRSRQRGRTCEYFT